LGPRLHSIEGSRAMSVQTSDQQGERQPRQQLSGSLEWFKLRRCRLAGGYLRNALEFRASRFRRDSPLPRESIGGQIVDDCVGQQPTAGMSAT
jgi:hypothetical protein